MVKFTIWTGPSLELERVRVEVEIFVKHVNPSAGCGCPRKQILAGYQKQKEETRKIK